MIHHKVAVKPLSSTSDNGHRGARALEKKIKTSTRTPHRTCGLRACCLCHTTSIVVLCLARSMSGWCWTDARLTSAWHMAVQHELSKKSTKRITGVIIFNIRSWCSFFLLNFSSFLFTIRSISLVIGYCFMHNTEILYFTLQFSATIS